MKFVIVLRSKHTGDRSYLGSRYETEDEARAYADRTVCLRCNSVSIETVSDDAMWIGRREGFGICRSA